MENATSSSNMASFSNFVWPIVTTVDSQTLKSSPDSEKKNETPFYCLDCKTVVFFFSKSLKKLASHADVLRDSSRFAAPRTPADLSGKRRRPITADFQIWEVHFGP